MFFRPDEISEEHLRPLTAEQEVADWMKSTPVSAQKRPEWLAAGEHWTPRPAPARPTREVVDPTAGRPWLGLSLAGVGVASAAVITWYALG